MDSNTVANISLVTGIILGIPSAIASVFTILDYFRTSREKEEAIKAIIYRWLDNLANRTHKEGLREFARGDIKSAYGYCDVALSIYTEIRDRENIPALKQDLADIRGRIEDAFHSSLSDREMRSRMYDPQQQPTGQRRRI